jgi:mannose-6-phosphate isomerase
VKRIALLDNPVREYAWGSRTAIAELLGEPAPSAHPQAELWMGAHPAAPSRVLLDGARPTLREVVRCDPAAVLGARVAARFDGELPFLLKVLAAEQPLSLQAHPDARQAAEGFAREQARGIPLDAPQRCYRDPFAKPELLCALTPFDALVGFRPVPAILERLTRAGLAGLAPELAALRERPDAAGLAGFFAALLELPRERRERVAREAAAAARLAAADPDLAWVARLAERHPADAGVLAPLLLERVRLAPGEALFLPAGELHAYLHGVGVEIMASSDNVLRGGLTEKHVDVPELLRVLRFRAGAPPILRPRLAAPGLESYDAPAREFALSVLRVRSGAPFDAAPERSVEILLCTQGGCRLEEAGGGDEVALARGRAAIVPAALAGYRIRGDATLFRASVPDA